MKINKLLPFLILIAGFLIGPTKIFSQEAIDTKNIDTFFRDTVSKNKIPGIALAVVQNQQVILLNGYGQATPKTQFYLGSVSKSFTALATMQLVEKGKLELDSPVQKYLPWFQLANKEASKKITLRNLLNHTSGLNEKNDVGAANYSQTLDEQIRNMKTVSLATPIGTKYQYDSQNYRILALIIEKVSGQNFSEYLKENIFKPLEMENSTADPKEFKNLTNGYEQMFGFPYQREEKFQPAGIGSGYIVSTAEDMAKYLIMILNKGQFNEKTLISEKSFVEMTTPPKNIKSEYGMGWITTNMSNTKVVYHGGGLNTFHVFAMILPEKNSGFVFLSNQNGIIPAFTVLGKLKTGMLDNLSKGTTLKPVSFNWLFWIIRILTITIITWQIYKFSKIKDWIIKNKKNWKKWTNALLDSIIPLLIFFGIPFFANTFLGASSADWKGGFNFLPDIISILMVTLASSFILGLIKIVILIKQTYSPTTSQ